MTAAWKVETHGTGDAPHWIVNAGGRKLYLSDYEPACLIAAAPALLEACEAFIADHDNTYDGEPMSFALYEAIEGMRAAIAKARGQQ